MKLVLIVASFCLGSVMANRALAHGGQQMLATDKGKLLAKFTFASEELRMKKELNVSIAYIEKTMTLDKALTLLRQRNNLSPDLMKVVEHLAHNDTHQFLQKQSPGDVKAKKAYGGVQAAHTLLNEMLEQIADQYEKDWEECQSNFNSKCNAIDSAGSDIANYNSEAADAAKKISKNQATITIKEKEIPRLKDELKHHKYDCEYKKYNLKQDEQVVDDDRKVMSKVLELAACNESNNLLQTGQALLKCKCQNGHHVVHFHDESLRSRLAQIKSKTLQNRIFQSLQDMINQAPRDTRAPGDLRGSDPGFGDKFDRDPFVDKPIPKNETVNETVWPPLPHPPPTDVPPNPCDDPDFKFNDAKVAGLSPCTYSNSPNCKKMSVKFLTIQGGIVDHLQYLRDELATNEAECTRHENDLLKLISHAEKEIEKAFTDLADGQSEWNDALEGRKETSKKHADLVEELTRERYECTKKLKIGKSEACALRKIRGELTKIKGVTYIPFFQDCDEGPWVKQDCSKSCGGGVLIKSRDVLVAPIQGKKCGYLKAEESCNMQDCPVDCVLDEWQGWGDCSAECGGGVKTRIRAVKQKAVNAGNPCGQTQETQVCDGQSCDQDCELSEWSDWGWSKDGSTWPWKDPNNLQKGLCSRKCKTKEGKTGKMIRFREVEKAASGGGTCPKDVYEEIPCTEESKVWDNQFQGNTSHPALVQWNDIILCTIASNDVLDPVLDALPCQSKVDVVLVLDSSNSLGEEGWKATKNFASKFVTALLNPRADARVSIIQYSGPATWDKFYNCADGASGNPEYNEEYRETECLVKIVQRFSNNRAETLTNIADMPFMAETTYTSLALETANAELMLARKGVPSVVLCLTDGYPISPKQTHDAAKKLTNSGARLMMVPIMGFGLDDEMTQSMEKMVSLPHSDNLIKIDDISSLELIDTVSMLVSDTCTY